MEACSNLVPAAAAEGRKDSSPPKKLHPVVAHHLFATGQRAEVEITTEILTAYHEANRRPARALVSLAPDRSRWAVGRAAPSKQVRFLLPGRQGEECSDTHGMLNQAMPHDRNLPLGTGAFLLPVGPEGDVHQQPGRDKISLTVSTPAAKAAVEYMPLPGGPVCVEEILGLMKFERGYPPRRKQAASAAAPTNVSFAPDSSLQLQLLHARAY